MVLLILQKQVQANVCVTMEMVKEALDQLRGAVMIVYPMGLPPHDPIRMEFDNQEELSGTQVKQLILLLFDNIFFSPLHHSPSAHPVSCLSNRLRTAGVSPGDVRG